MSNKNKEIKPEIDVNADTNPFVKASMEYMSGKRENQIPDTVTDKLKKCLNR